MNKNIIDAISEIEGKKLIKIGADNGTGFFFCGEAEKFLNNIDKYSDFCYQSAVNGRENSFDSLTNVMAEIKSPGDKEYNKWIDSMRRKSRAAYVANHKFENFKNLKDRNVVKFFESDPSADCECPHVFIVNGYEYGAYWTIEEAKGKPSFLLGRFSDL